MRTQRKNLYVVTASVLIALSTSLAGCSASAQKPVEDTSGASGEITVWSWSPNAQDIADLFEKRHPNIEVNMVDPGGGIETPKKLQTAFEAGSGAPDVAMMGYTDVPQAALAGYIVPLTEYGINEIAGDFTESIIGQLTVNKEVYGTPIDAAPMALLYRSDLYEQAGIQPPKTWDEFAETAVEFHAAFPNSYIANNAFADGTINQMLWQTGVAPIGVDGEIITIDYDHAEYEKVLDFWGGLKDAKLTGDVPAFSPEWNAAVADGTLASWVGPAWAPIILGSVAESSAGKWAVAPMPSWDANKPSSAEFGGSGYSVTKQSENKAAAAEYVKWVNHDPEAYELLFKLTGVFPVLKSYIEDKEFLSTPADFFGGQPVNATFATGLQSVPAGWQWAPFNSQVSSVTAEQYTALVDTGQDAKTTLSEIQAQLKDYAESQGFTVG